MLKKALLYFGADKIQTLKEMYKFNGGFVNMIYSQWRTDQIKVGQLVGEDKYGNKYYKNDRYPVGQNRWVVHNDKAFFEYDGSQIPGEWHNWLHYVCDDTPIENPRVEYKWMIPHTENMSDTTSQYVPYSTTPTKIKSWQPAGAAPIKTTVAK